MADNELVLKQRNIFGYDIKIKLVDGRELQIRRKGKQEEQTYSIDILSLQDKSEIIFCIAWKWLIAGVSCFLIMLLMLKILPVYLNANKNLYLGIVLFSGIIGGILCVVQFWKYTSRKQIFFSRKAHVPIITLNIGKPTKKAFFSFIRSIELRIKKFRNHMNIAENKQLTGEMKMLRRLSDVGIISKKDYENAKVKLFSGFDSHIVSSEE